MVHVDAVETEETVVASGEANKGGTNTGACRGPTEARRLETCVEDGGKWRRCRQGSVGVEPWQEHWS